MLEVLVVPIKPRTFHATLPQVSSKKSLADFELKTFRDWLKQSKKRTALADAMTPEELLGYFLLWRANLAELGGLS